MKLSKEIITWASQQGWEAIPIEDPEDIEVFITEGDDYDYWYGTPIPGTGGIKYCTPEEMIELFNNR